MLLLEAGTDYPPGTEPPEILDIFAATADADPRFTWPGLSAKFEPRPGNAPDRRPRRRYNQGRVIGGTSSVNGMAANRGLPSDYAAWVEAGATGWDWDGVLPFFKKLETDSDFDGPLHGRDGPIRLQNGWVMSGFARRALSADLRTHLTVGRAEERLLCRSKPDGTAGTAASRGCPAPRRAHPTMSCPSPSPPSWCLRDRT